MRQMPDGLSFPPMLLAQVFVIPLVRVLSDLSQQSNCWLLDARFSLDRLSVDLVLAKMLVRSLPLVAEPPP
jgi:hypothetical protein